MNKLFTVAAVVSCAALSACGGSNDDTVNADNSMMMDNLGTTDMNAGMDMNVDANMDANMDMNAANDMSMNATDNMTNSENTL